ncbi:hypothetical protein [Spirosoma pollinicola]|nr:hypothetical protein [Spirosoma pollinicola]
MIYTLLIHELVRKEGDFLFLEKGLPHFNVFPQQADRLKYRFR